MMLIFDLDGTLFQAKPVFRLAGEGVDFSLEKLLDSVSAAGELFPGAFEVVQLLHTAGYRMYICSQSPAAYIEKVLEHTGISRFFEGYKSAEGYDSKSKPIRELAQGHPAIVIGDTHGDITAAKQNGMKSIAVMYGYGNKALLAPADAFAESPGGIVRCVEWIMRL
ncbi:MAG: haloacid dehalogenase-like hydrolase [Oscillospiraceae bacterium]|nr:haloacid dehalogenase-like hydrolase [Oscillospiraceae bacterium]